MKSLTIVIFSNITTLQIVMYVCSSATFMEKYAFLGYYIRQTDIFFLVKIPLTLSIVSVGLSAKLWQTLSLSRKNCIYLAAIIDRCLIYKKMILNIKVLVSFICLASLFIIFLLLCLDSVLLMDLIVLVYNLND